MTLAEFERCLDTWGSTVNDWPPPQRAAAEALLAGSEAARTLLARQQDFERLFVPAIVPPAPSAEVLATVAMLQPQPARGIVVPLRRNWMALGWPHMVGLAACLAAGFVIGALDLPGERTVSLQTLDLIDGTGPSDD